MKSLPISGCNARYALIGAKSTPTDAVCVVSAKTGMVFCIPLYSAR